MKLKLLFFFLLAALYVCAPLTAQTPCFERNSNMAQKFFEKGNYEKAKEYCTKALQCDDAANHAKEKAAINALLNRCNEKLSPSANDDNTKEEKPAVKVKKASYLTVNGNQKISEHLATDMVKKDYAIMTDGRMWEYEVEGDFVTAVKSGGTLSLTIGQNTTFVDRKARVTLRADDETATIDIVQEGAVNTTPRVEVMMVPQVDIKQNRKLKNGNNGLVITLKVNYLYLRGKQIEIKAHFVDAEHNNKTLFARDSYELYAVSQLVIPSSDAYSDVATIELDYELLQEEIKEGTLLGVRFDAVNTQGRTLIPTSSDIEATQHKKYYTFSFSAKSPTATIGDGGTNSTIANNVRVEQNYYVPSYGAANATGRGLRFSTAYTMFNMMGHKARFAVLFYDTDEQPIIDIFDTVNSVYMPAMGIRQVAAIGDIENVNLDNILDTNHQLIAYRQLPINKAAPNTFKYKVAIFDMSSSTPMQLYESNDFGTVTFTPEERDIYRYLSVNNSPDTVHLLLSKEEDSSDTLHINTNYDLSTLQLYGTHAKAFKWKQTKDKKGIVIRSRDTNNTDGPIRGTLLLRVKKNDREFLDEVVIEIEQSNRTIRK
ncbi:MAG: hypothetical protein IJR13_06940 [Bacteroidales bacterium]|nr:hypothetical protein [Bacteroidales bacterium]